MKAVDILILMERIFRNVSFTSGIVFICFIYSNLLASTLLRQLSVCFCYRLVTSKMKHGDTKLIQYYTQDNCKEKKHIVKADK